MPSHRLILERGRSSGEWVLEWDAATLTLRGPDGEVLFEVPSGQAHRIVETYELYAEGKVSFATSAGSLTFKRQGDAARDLRQLVEAGLRSDAGYREAQKAQARRVIPLGLAAGVACGGLFAAYCWWASRAPDPPKGHWLYAIGWLIHLLLLGLLGLALGGPFASYLAWRQLRRVRAVERTLADPPAE
jgi:hypothetical protein